LIGSSFRLVFEEIFLFAIASGKAETRESDHDKLGWFHLTDCFFGFPES
jgi:hypothetical protein